MSGPSSSESLAVALDLEHTRQTSAGTARYATALAAALAELDGVSVLTVGGGPLLRRGTAHKRLHTARQDFWWYPHAGRRRARALGADVYHCPTPRAPLRAGTPPLVVTVHDLASLRHPETLTPWTRLYEKSTLRRVVRAAARIIAVSADTAADLQSMLGVPASKIRVVHNGVDAGFSAPSSSPAPFPFPYVLFVGTPQPRKNLRRLAAAVELLNKRGTDLRLVIAGSDGWGDVGLRDAHVVVDGRASDERLLQLYRHASCLALVSLHEGFGLPALEAMAGGAPVVVSTGGALPELVGDAAIVVDPLDIERIAGGIEEAIGRRDELVPKGINRARSFTWKATAQATLAVYRELV